MSPTDTLEKYLGRFAIPGLIRYVVSLNALVFLLLTIEPGYRAALILDRDLVLSGQVWRLVSWIFIPNTDSFIWVFFFLYFTWWLGDLIEGAWGTFRLNLYYFVGYLGCTAAALVFGQTFANGALIASLLFAVGTLMPNLEVMLFLVLPVKIKWVALFSVGVFVMMMLSGDWSTRAAIVVTFANYLLFFGPEFIRGTVDSRKTASRRAKFEAAKVTTETLHRCEKCGRTEVSDPDLEFRVTSSGKEFCTDHLGD
ncbi:MAG: hypothetical protein WA771_11845 [Chthoniobacterales bacterium]